MTIYTTTKSRDRSPVLKIQFGLEMLRETGNADASLLVMRLLSYPCTQIPTHSAAAMVSGLRVVTWFNICCLLLSVIVYLHENVSVPMIALIANILVSMWVPIKWYKYLCDAWRITGNEGQGVKLWRTMTGELRCASLQHLGWNCRPARPKDFMDMRESVPRYWSL